MRKTLSRATLSGLTLAWMMISTSCSHYKVISSDRAVTPLITGQPFTPSCDGVFVPDARWLEIRNAVSERLSEARKTK
jgi:hypothetical protein